LSQDAQNLVEVASMFLFLSAIYKNLIKVNGNKLACARPKHLIYESYEGAWCISQAKRHDQSLIKATFGLKSHLALIPFKDADLVIATTKINHTKDGGSMKFI